MTIRTGPSTIAIALTGALALTACGGEPQVPAEESQDATADDATETTQTTEAAPEDPEAPVEVCELLDSAEVAALLEDDLREPSPDSPSSYSLGACSWGAESNGRDLYVSARALDQWDSALESNDFGVEPIDGLGERAWRTSDDGLFVDPGDRHYFYQMFVIGLDGDINFDMSVQAAELLLD
ncbi:DUF3558 family protein [Demequina sp.]|uniref:DUF3558 family protein n=1 Tax=Demequina sp. TaxID=2050685 RepID=UPI0025B9D242|nr:DUF3558 family protein [Demequina sp.]